jgi:AraC-like DNA-binding protein
MNCLNLSRELRGELNTRDEGAFFNFITANLWHVAGAVDQNPGAESAIGRFEGHVRTSSAADFTSAQVSTRAERVHYKRGPSEIALDRPRRYALYLPVAGSMNINHFGREQQSGPGSMVLMSGVEPLDVVVQGDSDMLAIFMPQHFVEDRLIKAEELCCRKPSGSSGVQRLVFSAIAALQEGAADMSAHDLGKAIGTVSELAVLALGNLADVNSSTSPVRAANLLRAKRIIRARCKDPELTLADVAKECGLSLRYLHDLFRDDGRTLRENIIYERLQRARRMLEAGSPRTLKVTDVCFASGFSSLSFFSTAFRRTFSVSPVDVLRHQ